MLYGAKVADCFEIHKKKRVNTSCGKSVEFLGVFAKLLKATVSFMSFRPSAWNNSAGSHWTDFHEL
jgi:hypothetical protein